MNIKRLLSVSLVLLGFSGSSVYAEFDKKMQKTLSKSYAEVEYIAHSDCYRIKSKDKNRTSGICGADGRVIIEPIYQRILFEQGYNNELLAIALNPVGGVMGRKDNKIYSLSRGELFNSGPNEPQIIDGGYFSGYMMPIFDYNGRVVLDCIQTSVMPLRRNTKIIGYRVNHREMINKEPKDELWVCDEKFNRLFTLDGAGYLWKVEESKDENGNFIWLCTQNNAFEATETKRFSANGAPLEVSGSGAQKLTAATAEKPKQQSVQKEAKPQKIVAANDVKPAGPKADDKRTVDNNQKASVARQPLNRKSDVDFNIPKSSIVAENTFAVIICNQDYMEVAGVDFAANDGETFAQYCKSTLGIPESNIRLVKNATLNQMKRQIHWLSQISDAYGESAKFLVYYSGHGVPDESTHDAYLLPVDGFPADLTTGYKVNQLYSQLADMKAKQIVLIMDACFSGAQRNDQMMVAARGVALRPKSNTPQGNMIVLSAAQGNETAHAYNDKGHGMFTYFLLKKLKEYSNGMTLGELSDYIITEVKKASLVQNDKIQTPSISVSPILKDTWRDSSL